MPEEMTRWSAAQVLALAPDPAAHKAGQALGTVGRWQQAGSSADPPVIWGQCQGSGKTPYQTCVDLTEPAYRCSCPSRKFPCKHGLGLLLLWSSGALAPGEPPPWVSDWVAARTERADKAKPAPARPAKATDPATTAASLARRTARVDGGIAELHRWLSDQLRQGLAGASRAGYGHWDAMAARLVDAQAPGAASAVRRLAAVAGGPDRLLAELGLIWLLVRSYERIDELPPELAATVRGRIGFPVATEAVLAGPRVRDEWTVIGLRDETDERLTVRRIWLRGAGTGRFALVLAFSVAGAPLPADLVLGTTVEADLCFYPGALPLRALVAHRYGEAQSVEEPGAFPTMTAALDEYATAVAAEPWLDRWPMVLRDVVPVPVGARWRLRDSTGATLRLDLPAWPPWSLIAVAGGRPCTVSGEWSTAGLRPLAVWADSFLVQL